MPKTKDKPAADQVLDGEAIEKDVVDNTRQPAKRLRGAVVMTIVVVLALLGGATTLYFAYDQYKKTGLANTATEGLRDRIVAQSAQIDTLNKQVSSLDQAHKALLTAFEARQQQAVPTDTIKEAALAELTDQLDLVMDRLNRIEQDAQPITEQASDVMMPSSSGNDEPAPLAKPIESDLLLAQTGVVVVSAILADNTAGRPLAQWVPVLDGMAQAKNADAALLALRPLFVRTPPSRDLILADAHRFVVSMVHQTYDEDTNGNLIDQAGAQLAKLIQLRTIDEGRDDAMGHLARYEAALAAHNLEAAVDLAKNWPGPAIAEFDEWRLTAESRLALDRGIADALVASLAVMNALTTADAGEAQ